MKNIALVLLMVICLGLVTPVAAQDDQLVASLEVVSAGVEFQRAGTDAWFPIKLESLVGQGDRIRTDDTGNALVTFFADGTTAELEPNSEVLIQEFHGDTEKFNLTLHILAGVTRQQFNRLLDRNSSSYRVVTPSINMTVRGTEFAVRVEPDGRSALITSEGQVDAERVAVEAGFGVRAEDNGALSEVVPATSFDELDAALDGCSGLTTIQGIDVQLNVRQAPDRESKVLTTIYPDTIDLIMGVSEDGKWYRIPLGNERYGWVAADLVELGDSCDLLREFALTYRE